MGGLFLEREYDYEIQNSINCFIYFCLDELKNDKKIDS